jgi:capsular polysaccharide biosynthesis protein
MNNFFNTQRILELIWKRKFHFILVAVIAIVLSAIFSGSAFIKPKFKSTARIYPSNLSELSEESRSEQMLEIINSNDIKFKMFDAFALDDVYGISKDDPHYLTYMLDIYGNNVSASKTEYETVEIKVLDYLPQRASDMCDSIISFYNKKVGTIHKAKDWEMVEISKKQLAKKQLEFDSLKIQLDNIRKESDIIDFNDQVAEVTRGYMNALSTGRGSSSDTKKIVKMYESLSEKGTEAVWLQAQFSSVVHALDSLNRQHDVYLNEYEKNITYAHVVESPFPADKKSYPVRWLIVAFSTISAVFMALLVFLVLDYRKEE